MTMAELSQQGRLTQGTLRGGEPALFVTGVVESAQTVTDILGQAERGADQHRALRRYRCFHGGGHVPLPVSHGYQR